MTRITILLATLYSVLAHLAGFSAANLLLGDRFDVRIDSPTLLVSVNSDSEFINGAPLPAPAPVDPPTPRKDEVIAQLSTKAPLARNSTEPRIDLIARQQAKVAPSTQAPQATQALVTLSAAEFSAAKITQARKPGPPGEAKLSLRQEKMLEKKISKWARQLTEAPASETSKRWRHKGQYYEASFTQLPPTDNMGLHRVVVDISTDNNGERRSTQMSLKKLAFSNYAQLVDRWDPDVEIYNDEMEGRFHSNSEISLSYSRRVKPVFHGAVTTAAPRVKVKNTVGFMRRDEIFKGGLHTGVRSIRLPDSFQSQLNRLDLAADQLIRIERNSHLRFLDDGRVELREEHDDSDVVHMQLPDKVAYLIANDKVRLCVQGKVRGKVLVYSPERIIISGNLVYANQSAGARDFLGLVSDKVIEIAGIEKTGRGDLHIHGALYAKRRFAVRNHSVRNHGVLNVFGSLSAGSLTATEPRYRTRVRFDQRLHEQRPPGFPVTNHYEIEQWDKTWQVGAI